MTPPIKKVYNACLRAATLAGKIPLSELMYATTLPMKTAPMIPSFTSMTLLKNEITLLSNLTVHWSVKYKRIFIYSVKGWANILPDVDKYSIYWDYDYFLLKYLKEGL